MCDHGVAQVTYVWPLCGTCYICVTMMWHRLHVWPWCDTGYICVTMHMVWLKWNTCDSTLIHRGIRIKHMSTFYKPFVTRLHHMRSGPRAIFVKHEQVSWSTYKTPVKHVTCASHVKHEKFYLTLQTCARTHSDKNKTNYNGIWLERRCIILNIIKWNMGNKLFYNYNFKTYQF